MDVPAEISEVIMPLKEILRVSMVVPWVNKQSSAVPVATDGILVCEVQATEPGEVDVATYDSY